MYDSYTFSPCPYLGLEGDREATSDRVTAVHRCYLSSQPTAIPEADQERFCLGDYVGCPRYAARFPGTRLPSPPPSRVAAPMPAREAWPEDVRVAAREAPPPSPPPSGPTRMAEMAPSAGEVTAPPSTMPRLLVGGIVGIVSLALLCLCGLLATEFLSSGEFALQIPFLAPPTYTPTPTKRPTSTPTSTPTVTPTATDTPTPTPSLTPTFTLVPPTATPKPKPPTATPTNTPVPTNTPTPTPVRVAACQGDETMSFDPSSPSAGAQVTVTVTSSKGHTNVSLEGLNAPSSPTRVQTGGLGYQWEWDLTAPQSGKHTYAFYIENRAQPACAVKTLTVQ